MTRTPVQTDWREKLANLQAPVEEISDPSPYFAANVGAIRAALTGIGPDDFRTGKVLSLGSSGIGACMVVNISSTHIPDFCSASLRGDQRPYKNGYDMDRYKYHIGKDPPASATKLREVVDAALPVPDEKNASDIYFGAMELNGTGVYFYGDICLVVRIIPDETVVLESNSYDLVRTPLKNVIEDRNAPDSWPQRRANEARRMAGTWGGDRDSIAAIKVLMAVGVRPRRLTTGQISDALRADEDYIEILKIGSFGTKDLAEARTTAADSACEASIEYRRRTGSPPPLETIMWCDRRKVAERELQAAGVLVRVVTTSGRVKG